MSLFGGPLPADTVSDIDTPSPSPSSRESEDHGEDPSSRRDSIVASITSGHEEEYENPISNDAGFDGARPNRFRGSARQYRKFIASEIGLMESLDQLRAEDVSVHLYNAYAMKAQASDSTDRAGSKRSKSWATPAEWTAWPVEPERLPRPGERFGDQPQGDVDVFGTLYTADTKTELEECVTACCLKSAKDLWTDAGGSVNGSLGNNFLLDTVSNGQDQLLVMADDDRAKQIIQPNIDTIMRRCDDLLREMYTSRLAEHGIILRSGADTQFSKRWTRKKRTKRVPPSMMDEGTIPSPAPVKEEPTTIRRRGRPHKYRDRLEGESLYKMHARLALAKAHGAAATLPPTPEMDEDLAEGKRKRRRGNVALFEGRQGESESLYQMYRRLHCDEADNGGGNGHGVEGAGDHDPVGAEGTGRFEATEPRRVRVKPAGDWKRVLDMASKAGWDEVVIQRARERCEALFAFPTLGQSRATDIEDQAS